MHGNIIYGDDKLVAEGREYLHVFDGADILAEFARGCALDVVHLWDAPKVVKIYLATGDISLRAAAGAAARKARAASRASWEASWASRAATWEASWASWEASGEASRAASWASRAASWEASREASWAASWEASGASWKASWATQNSKLTALLMTRVKEATRSGD
ncbi:MAG: hypothetical protein A3K22_02115 [Deltaproteobacteria bacterium RBG_16_42_7]|nr:MAG: hypothetical protein A3K22_02115 [Deltaproteobacteria bacterium RBG_16_42_7]